VIIYRCFYRITGFIVVVVDFLDLLQEAWITSWAGIVAGHRRQVGISCYFMKLLNSC